jgi:hypothetical protein
MKSSETGINSTHKTRKVSSVEVVPVALLSGTSANQAFISDSSSRFRIRGVGFSDMLAAT